MHESKNKEYKISIIIPVYNAQDGIERCVYSIKNQTYKNLEIIIVNDGSEDLSWEIMQELAKEDKRIVLVNKTNGGVTSARLAGIRVAKGAYIGFVDADDEIEPNMYELLLRNAIKYNADISHCGYQMIFADGRVKYFYNTGYLLEQDGTAGVKELLNGSYVEPGLCNKLYRKKLFQKIIEDDVIPMTIKINEDLLMNYYLFNEAEKSVFEDKCPYHYLIHPGSVTRRGLNYHSIFDPIKVKKIILDNSREELLDEARRAYVRTCINVYNTLCIQENNFFKKEKKCVRRKILEVAKWQRLLSKKQMILAFMICKTPYIYPIIYRIYANIFMNNKYE